MSSPFPPPALSDRHLPPCPVVGSACMPSFDPLPLVPPNRPQTAANCAAAVTATVAAADYVLRPHCNHCQEDNIVVAVVLARGILVVVVNRSPVSTMMGPRPSFSWCDGN
jgi:hypothetical protein